MTAFRGLDGRWYQTVAFVVGVTVAGLAATRPPAGAADPAHPHLVGTWTVQATADGTPVEIRGSLRWIGEPDIRLLDLLPWVVLGVLVVIPIGVLIWQRRRAATSSGHPDSTS
jgi:hypothetical protein